MLAASMAVLIAWGTSDRPAPEFPTADRGAWVGEPARLSSLRGQVVLLDVWTFG